MTTQEWNRLDARLRQAIGSAAGELAKNADAQWEGRMFGNYRIESRVAAGGMGVVFRARRSDAQFERVAAVKLLNNPLASDDARRRFLAERQILADLNHPNIAQLLDGGTTPEGMPYLVMEFIEGLPIGEFCESNGLKIAERLRLFIRVCDAVQFAHQHLIVHRDIKASNILVTADGVPKLLDFGIAKLLRSADREVAADLTLADARLLTPRNASPEQVRGAAITTASDIYSLGVLLYELLAGAQPYQLSNLTATELERAICDTDPKPPSHVKRELAGDLDTIVMTAMRKEPERRYGTARQLADDIERHLTHRPVSARRERWSYRARKFVRRNIWSTAAALMVITVISGLVTFYTLRLAHESTRLARESVTAEEVSAFLVGLFEDADPSRSQPNISARQVLEDGAARVDLLRERQPLVASRLMLSMGRAYAGLGLYERSRELIADSLAIRRTQLPDGDPAIAEALHYLGVTQLWMREHDAALATLDEALRQREAVLGPDALAVGETLHRIGIVQHRRGDYPAMGAALRRALPLYERWLGSEDPATAEVLQQLGIHYQLVADQELSRATLERALAIGERAYGRNSIRIAATLQALGRLSWQQGKFLESVAHARRTLEIKEAHLGLEHPDLGTTLYGLATSSKDSGAFSEARVYYDRLIALQLKVLGPDDFYLALSYSGDGFLKLELGMLEEARDAFQRSLAIAERKWGPRHPDLRAPLAGLAKTLIELGEFGPALRHLERARAIVEPQFPPEHVDVLRTLSSIANLHRRAGDFVRARPLFEEVLARVERSIGTKHPFATEALSGMGEILKREGDFARADEYYRAAIANFSGPYSERRVALAESLEGHADLLRRIDRPTEAAAVAARAAAIRAYLSAEKDKASAPVLART
jgi:serine/threonine protein kinase/tetratricopeptide (TPR) repeat protein